MLRRRRLAAPITNIACLGNRLADVAGRPIQAPNVSNSAWSPDTGQTGTHLEKILPSAGGRKDSLRRNGARLLPVRIANLERPKRTKPKRRQILHSHVDETNNFSVTTLFRDRVSSLDGCEPLDTTAVF